MSSRFDKWRGVALSLAAACLLASCGDGQGDPLETTSQPAEDESMACPEGEIGWVFPTAEQRKDTELYMSQAGDDAVIESKPRLAIDVESIGCADGTTGTTYPSYEATCQDRQRCEIPLLPGSGCQTVKASYTCGQWDLDADGEPVVYEASGEVPDEGESPSRVVLDCDRRADGQDRIAGTKACIPAQCHGRTRRNLLMQCVPDDTKVEVAPKVRLAGAPKPKYAPQTPRNLEKGIEGEDKNWLYPNMPYTFTVEVDFHADLVPERSSVAIWMHDLFESSGGGASPKVFRCMAARVDIESSDPHTPLGDGRVRYTKTVTKVLSNGCFEDKVVWESGARLLRASGKGADYGWDDFKGDYGRGKTKLSLAYDMEGRTVFHKDAEELSLEELASHEPECAPNPPDFFYDARSQSYDLVEYFGQRTIGDDLSVEIAPDDMKRRMEIGTLDIKPRGDRFVIRADGGYTAPLPIDITWYAVNLRDASPINPFPADGVSGRGWSTGDTSHNYGPLELRADVYIMPVWDRQTLRKSDTKTYRVSEIRNKVASLPLREGLPEGRTDTVMLEANDWLRSSIVERNRYYPNMYVENRNEFYVYYCIRSSTPRTKSGNSWPWAFFPDRYSATEDIYDEAGRRATNFVIDGFVTEDMRDDPMDALALESEPPPSDETPFWGQSWRGCRRAETTIDIEVDRFVSPTEATFEEAPDNISSRKASGDAQMTSEGDNDREVICDDATKQSCTETAVSGSRSSGTTDQSAFQLKMTFKRGKKGGKVSTSLVGEMMGFQLVDPSDPATEEKDASGEVALEIGPNWESIADRLNSGKPATSPWKWSDGTFGGVSGLGIAWSKTMRTQIGPVPVQATLTFTIGAGVGLTFKVAYTPSVGSTYPCVGTGGSCLVFYDEKKSFADAAESCLEKGGRLAELSTAAEANHLLGDLSSHPGPHWIGAQLAYRYPKTDCIHNYNQAACSGDGLRAEARWLSNSKAFGAVEKTGAMSLNDEIHGGASGLLWPDYPNFRGVYVTSPGVLSAASVDEEKAYACNFEPVAQTSFASWSSSIDLGAGAGLTLSGCSPTDDPGFCVELSVNLIGAKISAVLENGYHWLSRVTGEAPYKRSGYVKFSIPWELKLLDGSVSAILRLLFWEESWQLYAWDGLIDEGGTLIELTAPVMEDFE